MIETKAHPLGKTFAICPEPAPETVGVAEEGWYCLKTQPKHEHVAAASLRTFEGVETFCPRIRYRKPTRRGPVWFVEAVFPGYLFARFDFTTLHRQVRHANGVMTIVHFGDQCPTVDHLFIETIRSRLNHSDNEVIVIEPKYEVGSCVTLASGAFAGLEAVITRVVPAKERVLVLLEFLGRQVEAEIANTEVNAVDPLRQHPLATD